MVKEPLAWRDDYESIRVTLAVIVLFTWRRSTATFQVDTREANVNATIKPPEKEKTETDAMQRGTAWHGDASFPLRECDCRRSIDARRHYAEARMNCDKRKDEQTGKCFRVVPCTILLLLNTDDALTLGERRMVSELRRRNEKGKALLRGVPPQMPFFLGSLHVYLFNLSALVSWLSICPANYRERSVMSPIKFLPCRGETFDT